MNAISFRFVANIFFSPLSFVLCNFSRILFYSMPFPSDSVSYFILWFIHKFTDKIIHISANNYHLLFFPTCLTTRCTFMDFWWMCIEVRFRWELGTIVVCHFNQMEWWHVTECNWYTMIDGSILEIWLSSK